MNVSLLLQLSKHFAVHLAIHPQIQLGGYFANDLFGRIARQAREARIDLEVSAVRESAEGDGIGARLDHPRVFLFRLT